jgi:RNA polymerase sigma-70 factor, ECF subfamily
MPVRGLIKRLPGGNLTAGGRRSWLKRSNAYSRIQTVEPPAGEAELAIASPTAIDNPSAGEQELVRAAQEGSQAAVERLVNRYWAELHRAAFLIVQDEAAAEDIAQESILAAISAIGRFNRRRPLRPWLHRIAVNRSLDYLRRAHRRYEVSVENVEAGQTAGPDELGGEAGAIECLRRLDPEQRALIVYRQLWGYEPHEIAKALGLSRAAARTRLHRALERLRQELKEGRPDER